MLTLMMVVAMMLVMMMTILMRLTMMVCADGNDGGCDDDVDGDRINLEGRSTVLAGQGLKATKWPV